MKTGDRKTCPVCSQELGWWAGEKNEHHWHHLVEADCWYRMTPWHLWWQSLFEDHEREVRGKFPGHRPDICLDLEGTSLVLEIQHSHMTLAMLCERERVYSSNGGVMVWVIDDKTLGQSTIWTHASTPVLIDTGYNIKFKDQRLPRPVDRTGVLELLETVLLGFERPDFVYPGPQNESLMLHREWLKAMSTLSPAGLIQWREKYDSVALAIQREQEADVARAASIEKYNREHGNPPMEEVNAKLAKYEGTELAALKQAIKALKQTPRKTT